MRLYLELAKKSFQRQVAYRTAALAGLITNLFFGVLRASILIAVYNAQTNSVPNYSVRDAITYTGMTQAFIGALAVAQANNSAISALRELADSLLSRKT